MRIEVVYNWKIERKSIHRSAGYSLKITFDHHDLFLHQTETMAKLLDEIAEEINLSELNQLQFDFLRNADLAIELASIPEIAKHIEKNSAKGHRWVSLTVVEENLHKSKLINDCLSIFEKFDLEFDWFMVDKCNHYKQSKDGDMRMICANIFIKFRRANDL